MGRHARYAGSSWHALHCGKQWLPLAHVRPLPARRTATPTILPELGEGVHSCFPGPFGDQFHFHVNPVLPACNRASTTSGAPDTIDQLRP